MRSRLARRCGIGGMLELAFSERLDGVAQRESWLWRRSTSR